MNRDKVEALAGKKILFASMPADGHVNPLTGLAMHLQQQGCDVRWYTGQSYASKMEQLGIRLYPYSRATDLNSGSPDELFPGREKIKSKVKKLEFDMIHFFIKQAPGFIEDLREIREQFAFDIVIAECTFTAIPIIKKVFRVPVIGIGIVPLTETSRDLPPVGLGMTPSSSMIGKLRQGLLRFVCDRVLFRKANLAGWAVLDSYGVDHRRSNMFDTAVKSSDLYLQSGTPGFEYRRSDMGKNIRYIGSLLPFSPVKKSNQWYDARLSHYDRVVLVTQGTVEKDVNKLIVPTLEAFKNTDTLVVCATGGAHTEELRSRFPQKNIIIEDFIPFSSVMPYVNVYITNGGYGGVMLGIENELPMIAAGVHEGKNEICARVGYFRLGINLGTEKPRASQIKSATDKILTDPTYRANVQRLSKEFSRYNPNELCARYVAAILTKPVDSEPAIIVSDVAA